MEERTGEMQTGEGGRKVQHLERGGVGLSLTKEDNNGKEDRPAPTARYHLGMNKLSSERKTLRGKETGRKKALVTKKKVQINAQVERQVGAERKTGP